MDDVDAAIAAAAAAPSEAALKRMETDRLLEIEALAVHGPHTILDDIHSHASDDLEKMLVGLQDEGISCEYEARDGSPDQVIVKLARDKKADLIVMGTRGRTGLAHAILGSVAERVIRTAPCPVMTVKQKED